MLIEDGLHGCRSAFPSKYDYALIYIRRKSHQLPDEAKAAAEEAKAAEESKEESKAAASRAAAEAKEVAESKAAASRAADDAKVTSI